MKDYYGYKYEYPKDSPGMRAIKKTVKEIAVEQYIKKGLHEKEAPAWKKTT